MYFSLLFGQVVKEWWWIKFGISNVKLILKCCKYIKIWTILSIFHKLTKERSCIFEYMKFIEFDLFEKTMKNYKSYLFWEITFKIHLVANLMYRIPRLFVRGIHSNAFLKTWKLYKFGFSGCFLSPLAECPSVHVLYLLNNILWLFLYVDEV